MSGYTIVIADDEEIERKALRLLLQKEFPEVELLAAVDNGTDLVAAVQRLAPDIAIVDVNMPGMGGIDAIDLLCAKGSRTRFIINTAYDEFDYVQRALALKVDAYLLKPQKRETTVGTLRKLCSQIDESRANSQSQRQIRELFGRIQPVLESEIMYSLFIGDPAVSSFEAYCEMHAVPFYGGAVASLVPVQPGAGLLQGTDRGPLRAAVDAAFGGSCTYLATVTANSICLLIFTPQQGGGSRWLADAWLADVLRVALAKLNRGLPAPLRAGLGSCGVRFDQMAESYQQSLLALLEPPQGGVGFFVPHTGAAAQETRALAGRLARMVREGSQQQLTAELARIQPFLRGSPGAARRLWQAVCEELGGLTGAAAESCRRTGDLLARAEPGADVTPLLREGLCQLAGQQADGAQGQSPYVRGALEYIDQNYASDLSLDLVAGELGISPYYLSRLFRAGQGESFVEYLTRVRMEAAVRLARETRLSIKEIARQTGYSNPAYFCRVFKKATGRTIGELRGQRKG